MLAFEALAADQTAFSTFIFVLWQIDLGLPQPEAKSFLSSCIRSEDGLLFLTCIPLTLTDLSDCWLGGTTIIGRFWM